MRQYYRVMAPGDPERPDRPEYNVYRAGSGRRGRAKRDDNQSAKRPVRKASDDASPDEGRGYTVYKSRRGGGLFGGLRERFGGGSGDGGSKRSAASDDRRFPPRRIAKWVALALGAWLLLSLILFCVSAQIQKGKLDKAAASQLGAFPLMLFSGQTILVIGTDIRPPGVPDDQGNPTKQKCVDAAASGAVHPDDCLPARADTLMLVRAGGGSFEKLSIPRDSYAAIPGHDPQKINAAYAFGGAALQIRTVEDFLGIDIDHVVILDFQGFADFIDAIGGVQVNLPTRVKSKISGGASNGGITLKLDQGENTLDGQQALALARTRENLRVESQNDRERAQRQQLILNGIQDRLTSPTRLPYNIIHAPWIAWNAPKAMVTDMGAFTLPQLALSSIIGGGSDTQVLKPSTTPGPGGSLIIKQRRCRQAVQDFLGEAGPHKPKCSPETAAEAPVDTTLPTEVAPTPTEPVTP
jgi:LCP family protein required for cell wall assembly